MFDKSIIENAKRLHFVGIGGSGMFPLVQILHARGYAISGSDNNEGDIVDQERAMGIPVTIGHSADNLGNAELVIYSAAIMQDNAELAAARESGIPTAERSDILGYVTGQYDNCICVSGTHGKTTVTAMLTHILVGAGLDPTAVIGGKLSSINGYGRAGKSEIMTCEACEFVDTFLHLSPDTAVILNIDADHLDYFGTLENIIASFEKFSLLATKLLIVNGEDANTLKAVENVGLPRITFGFGSACDYYAQNIVKLSPYKTSFELMHGTERLCTLELSVPGRHNILNAVAAAAAAISAGATPEQIAQTLPGFTGAGRRFEILGNVRGVTIADDYAHHPAELDVTLRAAKEMGFRKVWAVFQPFTYSRTALLLDDFATALALADHVVMPKIMGAREQNTYNIYTKDLGEKIDGAVWFEEFPEVARHVMDTAQEGDLVITLGCGDVYKCARMMLHM